jgi:hypothetical protein
MRTSLAIILCTVSVVGCGDSSSGNMDMGNDGRASAMCTADGKTVALSAKYGVLADLLVNVKVTPNCMGASCIVNNDEHATLLLLADVTQNGTTATVTARPCKITVPKVALKGGNKPVQLSAPTALIESVKPVTSMGTLDGTMTCANFVSQPITLAIGANLANPGSDPLPSFTPLMQCGGMASTRCLSNTTPAPNDVSCVCDQDGDGKLGGTLDAQNAPGFDDIDKIYVDLRTSVTLSGQIFPEAAGQANPGPRIQGKVVGLKLDQNVLGCHRALAGTPRDCDMTETNTVAGFNPAVTQSVNGDSLFQAVPLAATATCAELIAQETSLFN